MARLTPIGPAQRRPGFLYEHFHSRLHGLKAGVLPAGGGAEYFLVLLLRDPLGRIMSFQVQAMADYLRVRPEQWAAFREVQGREAAAGGAPP